MQRTRSQGSRRGADYITKPFHAEEVLARVRTHVALFRLQSELGLRIEEQTETLRLPTHNWHTASRR